jgi:TolB-like protein
MSSSINFSHRTLLILIAIIGISLCAGCADTREIAPIVKTADIGKPRIAVLPIENLSGAKAPLKELRQAFMEKVKAEGFELLPDTALNQFLARHRVRYIGGIDEDSATALAAEERVDAVLITSLEYYSEVIPPKIAITARLVSAGKDPEILWMDSVGLAGNDSPGVFQIGVISKPGELTDKALGRLGKSLSAGLSPASGGTAAERAGKAFPPRLLYLTDLAPDRQFRIVVLPFYNLSGRKYAGEIMTLRFIQELRKLRNFRIVEPGVVRNGLLHFRLIMEGGVSFANADVAFDVLRANLVLTGKTINYQDEQGETGVPRVVFSATILDKENRMVVLASDSYNAGDDRVLFFDFGRISTALGVATEMVRGVVEKIASPFRTPTLAVEVK